jgi:DNA-damage-inducible protein J
MYGQALVQARMDSQLKDSVAAIYDALGIDLSTAIRMFFKKTLMVGGIPFEMVLPAADLKRKSFNDLFEAARAQISSSGMTEKDVAEEIAAYRRERRQSRKTARR